MIFGPRRTVRLTPSELNELRRANAKVGLVVNEITTVDELLAATVSGLDPALQEDLLAFLDGDADEVSSPKGP